MKLSVEINDQAKSGLGKKFVRRVVFDTLGRSGLDFLAAKNLSISVAVVTVEEIRELNRLYRKRNKPTDILSFPEYSRRVEILADKSPEIFLGELILCYNDIKEYARSEKKDLETELAEVISHGVLHLLSLRHGEKMFGIQKEVARSITKNSNTHGKIATV